MTMSYFIWNYSEQFGVEGTYTNDPFVVAESWARLEVEQPGRFKIARFYEVDPKNMEGVVIHPPKFS